VRASVCYRMDCGHNTYRTIDSSYDHRRGLFVYYWRCEQCGERLGEAGRLSYRPNYRPRSTDSVFRDVAPS
jgi:hypothetical protein